MQSYDEILHRMKQKYTERTGTDPDRASDIGIRMEVLAGELYAAFAELGWLRNQMFPATATGEMLERHALERGITRKSGEKAIGEVDFYLESLLNYDVVVPAGTVCATTGEDPVRFETTEEITISSGRLSGRAPIIALEAGSSGNVAEQEITVLVTPASGVARVLNDERTVYGADDESDDELRQRVLDSFINISNGTNKAYYLAQALSVDGVTAAGIIPRNRGAGTVDVFVTTANGSPSPAVLAAVRNKLQEAREINVDVAVSALRIIPCNVYMELAVKSGYDFEQVKSGVTEALRRRFNAFSGGETVYLSKLGEAVEHVDGVKNYSFIRQLMYDTEIPADGVARCGSVSITERE